VSDELARAAARETVDLVVMGLRGAATSDTGRVGSVAYRMLTLSPVPVLALPAESRQAHVLGFLG
jgi:nucleotide-binding universal stress UspA family protein